MIKKIKCYYHHEFGSYLIRIGNSEFEMSTDANQPNGVNCYIGEIIKLRPIDTNKYKEVQLGDLPKGTLIGIINRLRYDC